MISLLCPTRNRPDNVLLLMKSARETAEGELEFVFYTDDDAPLPQEVTSQPGVVTICGPRIVLSAMWNRCAEEAYGDILMQAADDIRFRTPRWDSAVKMVFGKCPDKILLVHGEDGIQGGEPGDAFVPAPPVGGDGRLLHGPLLQL